VSTEGERRNRLIVLGASNVVLGLPQLLDEARARLGAPLDVLAAFGFGRSYGLTSRVLGRGLPGILQSGLWPALGDGALRERTQALVLDVGNDLLYGAEPDTIAGWVGTCLERLRPHAANIVLGGLPAGLETVSRSRYLLFRTLFYPPCRLPFATAQVSIQRLGEQLAALAREHGLPIAANSPAWYGFDPIHVRRAYRRLFWQGLLGGQVLYSHMRPASGAWRLLPPERRTLLGLSQRRHQPAARLEDGTTLAFY
jgi:hypothetical protein